MGGVGRERYRVQEVSSAGPADREPLGILRTAPPHHTVTIGHSWVSLGSVSGQSLVYLWSISGMTTTTRSRWVSRGESRRQDSKTHILKENIFDNKQIATLLAPRRWISHGNVLYYGQDD